MEHPHPRRRQDLRITEQEQDEEKIYIVVDEKSGHYYQFRDVEFDIFWNLDGDTSLSELKEKIEDMIGDVEIPLDHLEGFVDDLFHKGLLEGSEQTTSKQSFWSDLFYLRFKAFDPDSLLNRIVTPLSFMYTKRFVAIGLILIVWSLGYSFLHQAEWFSQARDLLHGEGLLIAYVALLLVAFVHEMGHALTCKHYGGNVKEIGFMFIYFQPAFYANVTDAYLFKNKLHKAYVGAGGLFFQFVFGALVVALWYLAIPGSTLNAFLIAMMGMSGFTAFWNFNPLIKLDGYYVLSDLLGVTNLRANSFSYMGLLFQRWLFGLPEDQEQIEAISPRLRKIYFWYGILGIAYTAFILYILVRFLAVFLTRNLQGLGFLVFAGGFAWAIWNWYKGVIPGILNSLGTLKGNPELQAVFNTKMGRIRAGLVLLLVLGLIPTRSGLKGPCEVKPDVRRALAAREAGIVSKVFVTEAEPIQHGGIFAVLDDFTTRRELLSLKTEQKLKQEQLLALNANYGSSLTQAEQSFSDAKLALMSHDILSPHMVREARANYLKAKADYERTHDEYTRMQNGDSPERIAQIEEELKKAESELKMARHESDRFQELGKQELASPKEVEEKTAAYDSANSEAARLNAKLALARKDLIHADQIDLDQYRGARAAYRRISEQSLTTDPIKLQEAVRLTGKNFVYTKDRSAEIREAELALDEVTEKIETDEQKLERMKIRSPIDGIIMTPRVKELEGKMVGEGQQVAWVYQPGPMIFEIHMDELDVSEVPHEDDLHNDVTLKLLAIPGTSFRGKVLRIIPENLANPKGRAYLVDVAVDDINGKLLPGMEGTGKIYGRWHPALWQFVRRPVKYIFWKMWSLF